MTVSGSPFLDHLAQTERADGQRLGAAPGCLVACLARPPDPRTATVCQPGRRELCWTRDVIVTDRHRDGRSLLPLSAAGGMLWLAPAGPLTAVRAPVVCVRHWPRLTYLAPGDCPPPDVMPPPL